MSLTPRARLGLATGLVAGSLIGGTLFGPAAQAAASASTVSYDGTGSPGQTVSALATTAYTFVALNRDKTPVRWDPCTPIHYRINRNGIAPKSEIKYVKAAVRKLYYATGIKFVYDGPTRAVPDTINVSASAKTDLIFAFANPGKGAKRSALLPKSRSVLGIGGMQYRTGWGLDVARADEGVVVIKGSAWKGLNRRHRTTVYLHELAHTVGLDHSSKRTQVMYPAVIAKSPTAYMKWDKIGLKKLGRTQGCVRPVGTPKKPTVTVSGANLVVATGAVKAYGKNLKYVLTMYDAATGGTRTWTRTTPTFTVAAPAGSAGFTVTAKDSLSHVSSPMALFTPSA